MTDAAILPADISLGFTALFVAWAMLMAATWIRQDTVSTSKWRWLSKALYFWGLSLLFIVCLKLTVALIVY